LESSERERKSEGGFERKALDDVERKGAESRSRVIGSGGDG